MIMSMIVLMSVVMVMIVAMTATVLNRFGATFGFNKLRRHYY